MRAGRPFIERKCQMYENSIYVGGMEERCLKVPDIALDGNNDADVLIISGGPVQIIEMALEITEAVSAHNCAMGWISDPTADGPSGTNTTDIATSGVDIISAKVGDIFYAELDATTPVKSVPGGALPVGTGLTMIVPVGGVDFTFANATPTSGIGTLFIRYKPLAPGARVSA